MHWAVSANSESRDPRFPQVRGRVQYVSLGDAAGHQPLPGQATLLSLRVIEKLAKLGLLFAFCPVWASFEQEACPKQGSKGIVHRTMTRGVSVVESIWFWSLDL